MFNAELLSSEEIQILANKVICEKWDVLRLSTFLSKKYSNEDRACIMDYLALVPKFREKFALKNGKKTEAKFLLCDKLALEQSTAFDIGSWKSGLWPSGEEAKGKVVHDLCCGMGGDSFFLPQELSVIGVDLDENRLAMYRNNSRVMRSECGEVLATSSERSEGCKAQQCVILGDVREIARQNDCEKATAETTADATIDATVGAASQAAKADYFTIDPARRAIEGENQRDLRNLTPTLEEVIEISKHYKGGMAKLPPGYPINELPSDTEIIYIGGHADCRECLVLFGELAKHKATVRAVMVTKTGETQAEWSAPRAERNYEIEEQIQQKLEENDSLDGCDRTYRTSASYMDLPLGDVSSYISEPTATLLRSHLFGTVAQSISPDAHLISEGIAYVSSEKPLPSPGFSTFKIIDQCEIATAAVRNMLKLHDAGKITLKLRGVKLDPDAEIKRLKPKGKREATLFYTRVKGEKTAILAERI